MGPHVDGGNLPPGSPLPGPLLLPVDALAQLCWPGRWGSDQVSLWVLSIPLWWLGSEVHCLQCACFMEFSRAMGVLFIP